MRSIPQKPTEQLLLLLPLLLQLLLLLPLPPAAAQRRLSEEEMKALIGLRKHDYPTPGVHECVFLRKRSDSFSAGRPAAASEFETFHLDCCGGRTFPICGSTNAEFVTRCCPGYLRFEDPITGQRLCNQRVLADRDALSWLRDFRSDSVSLQRFFKAFVNSFETASVLRRAANRTWTVFAVADAGFQSDALPGFTSAGGCTNDTIISAGVNGTSKTEEGTDEHKRAIYLQTCRAFRSNTTADFTKGGWKYLVSGRKYISDLRSQSVVLSQLRTAAGAQYPLKFSRYSNGISCIECSPILEANHEAANAVVHIIGRELAAAQAGTVGAVLQQQFADFWSLLDSETQAQLSSDSCSSLYTVFVPRRLARVQALDSAAAAAAARRHVLLGLWCTAGMIDAASQPLVTMATSSVRFACDAGSRRQLQFGSDFRDSSSISSTAGEFDIMAVNGVLHVVDDPLLPAAAVILRSGVSAAASSGLGPTAARMLRSLLTECRLHFDTAAQYIVLLPTEAAFSKLLYSPSYSSSDERHRLQRSRRLRCWLLRHHVLRLRNSQTPQLSRAVHRQQVYSTVAGGRLADFLTRREGRLTAHFMEAKVSDSAEGREFAHGRLYRIDRVLLPAGAAIWRDMLQSLYSQQRALLREFSATAAALADGQMLTLLLPSRGHRRLLDAAALRRHTLSGVLYLPYLPDDGESMDFSSLDGGVVTVSRLAGRYAVAAAGHSRVQLHDCGVRVPNAVICSIEQPLDTFGDLEPGQWDAVPFTF